jgi:hypothetical protein
MKKSMCLKTSVLSLILMFLFVFIALAEDSLPDGVIEWMGKMERDERGIIFSEQVVYYSGDIKITADRLHLDEEDNIAVFSGNVAFTSKEQTIYGKELTYNIPKKTSLILSPRGIMKTDQIKGELFFKGEELRYGDGKINLSLCTVTTCKGEQPGYYFAAETIEIVPDKYLSMTGVRFVESGIILFYWPKLVIPIDEQGIRRPPLFPMIGKSDELGWYVKYSHPYGPQTEAGGGYIDLRWAQKEGFGLGLTHVYARSDALYGEASFFGVFNKYTKAIDHEYKLSGTYDQGNWDISLNTDMKISGVYYSRNLKAGLNVDVNNSRPSGVFIFNTEAQRNKSAYSKQDTLQSSITLKETFQSLGITTELSGNFHYLDTNNRSYKLFSYYAMVADKNPPITWEISAKENFHPDLIKQNYTGTPSYYTTGYRPEILVGANSDLKIFTALIPLKLQAGYGLFHETLKAGEPSIVTPRITGTLELRSKSVNLFKGLNLRLSGYYNIRYYGTEPEGIKRNVRNLSATLTYRPKNNLSLTNTYSYLAESVPSPLRADKITPQNKVRTTLLYNFQGQSFSVSSGYNFRTKRIDNLNLSLQGKVGSNFNYRLSSTYDIYKKKITLLAATMEYGGDGPLTLKLGGSHRFTASKLNNIDASVLWKLAGWELSYGGRYLIDEKRFEKGIFSILKDLECRKFGFSYNQSTKEFWLEYKITAIPDFGLKLGSREDGLMFSLDGWQDLLGIDDTTTQGNDVEE